MKNNNDRRNERLYGLLLATTALSVGASNSASAQEVAQDSPTDGPRVEEILVTGTRLTTGNSTSVQPITTLNEQAFESTGALTVSSALAELPQFGNSQPSGSSVNALNAGFGVGTQTINLRNLGANRTLVLVNGRRHVGGDVGTSAVDLSSIPSVMIERIEVLTGSNAAIYGADAVTGVVNIILKSNFSGTQISARTGITSRSDGNEYSGNLLHGGTIGSAEYVVGVEYSKQEEILGKDRPFSQFDGSAATGLSSFNNGSGVNPGGSYTFVGRGTGGFDPSGNFVIPFSERFNRVPYRSLQPETERLIISARGSADVNDTIKAFVETSYANTKVGVQFEPQLAQFSNATFGTGGTAGFIFPAATGVNVASVGGTLIPLSRRITEFGPRLAKIDRSMFRIATGIDGSWSRGKWHLSYQYGQVTADQTDFNTIDKFRLLTALDPVKCAATSGCKFVNIFGRNTVDPASLDWVSDDLVSKSKSTQHVASGYVTADLFDIGGRKVGMVLGTEYRKESAVVEPNPGLLAVINPLTNKGFVGLKGTRTFFGNTVGSYDVIEGFTEVKVPLFDKVDLGLSGRVSHYSTVGTEYTYGVNADWQIIDAVRARVSYGRATRAPNILELNSPDQVATAAISDPCDTRTDAGAPLTQAAGCSAFVGADFNPTDFQQNIRGIKGGNPNLRSEVANTFTGGVVFAPSRRITFSADYFNIAMTEVLAPSFSPQAILTRCIATQDPQFCDAITRDSAGIVTAIRSTQVNLAKENVSGLEFAFNASMPLGSGNVNFDAVYTRLLKHDRKVNDTAAIDHLVGRVDNIRNRARGTVSYAGESFALGTTVRFLDSAVQSISANPAIAIGNKVKSITYVDLFGSLNVTDKLSFQVGVENLFDIAPPTVTDLFENQGSADVVAAGIYDVRGTFFHLTAKVKF